MGLYGPTVSPVERVCTRFDRSGTWLTIEGRASKHFTWVIRLDSNFRLVTAAFVLMVRYWEVKALAWQVLFGPC